MRRLVAAVVASLIPTLVSAAPQELPAWLGGLTLSGVRAFERSWDVRLENGHIEVESE